MNFGWLESETAVLMRDSINRFCQQQYSLEQRKDVSKSELGYSEDAWRFYSELGVMGMLVPERFGGFESRLSDVAAVHHALGSCLVLEPLLVQSVAALLLGSADNADQFADVLQGVVTGNVRLTLGPLNHKADESEVRYRMDGDRCIGLSGCVYGVASAHRSDYLLVVADGSLGQSVFVVDLPQGECEYRSYRRVDGCRVADVYLDRIDASGVTALSFDDTHHRLQQAHSLWHLLASAQCLGISDALFSQTSEYTQTRKQFGQSLSSFQVVRHRLVDAYSRQLQCHGLMESALLQWDADDSYRVMLMAHGIYEASIDMGHEAIQLHGGMGLTDELIVSHYHKRLLVLTTVNGGIFGVQARLRADVRRRGLSPVPPILRDLEASDSDLQVFAEQVRNFLTCSLDDDLKQAVACQTISFPELAVTQRWQEALRAQGWLAPMLPEEHGGTGWTPEHRFVYEYLCGFHGAPRQVPMGLLYVGPVIAKFGDEWQKQYFLPRLLSGEHYWAQGFSEPNAGSDLAAIQTQAVADGDHYIVNGSKMWTTHAHFANWLFCLVRTEKTAKRQQGISFLLIDMTSEGVSVSPIDLLAVDHEVNQVFLDNVRVPKSHLIGVEGRGWDYAKFLLELERGGTVFSGSLRHELSNLRELLDEFSPASWEDAGVLDQLVVLEQRVLALESMEYQSARNQQKGGDLTVMGSNVKLVASELEKDITELAMRLTGTRGLEFCQKRPLHNEKNECNRDIRRLVTVPRYLNMRVATIYGGSSEIQKEIIAKQGLKLG